MNKKLLAQTITNEGIFVEKEITLKSGEKTDYYYDFGQLNTPLMLRMTVNCMSQTLSWSGLASFNIHCIFTSAVRGIHIATALLMDSSFYKRTRLGIYRSDKKNHGIESNLIGYMPKENDKVLLVDDVFTTGRSLKEMADFLKDTGCDISGAIVLLNRSENDEMRIQEKKLGFPIFAVLTHAEVMAERGKVVPKYFFQ